MLGICGGDASPVIIPQLSPETSNIYGNKFLETSSRRRARQECGDHLRREFVRWAVQMLRVAFETESMSRCPEAMPDFEKEARLRSAVRLAKNAFGFLLRRIRRRFFELIMRRRRTLRRV